ncbi:MAG: hypothetical protein ACJ8EA_09935, partial [Xanthobacteraceae bacterium]
DVVDVARTSGDEALVLHPPHRLADPEFEHVFPPLAVIAAVKLAHILGRWIPKEHPGLAGRAAEAGQGRTAPTAAEDTSVVLLRILA